MRRPLLLALLIAAALVLAVVGWIVGGLALVLGAVAAILLGPRPRVLLLAVGLGGLVIALIVAFATGIDPDECFGECVEIAGRGYDPFILVFALINFLGWCLGLIIGRILRPLVLSTP